MAVLPKLEIDSVVQRFYPYIFEFHRGNACQGANKLGIHQVDAQVGRVDSPVLLIEEQDPPDSSIMG